MQKHTDIIVSAPPPYLPLMTFLPSLRVYTFLLFISLHIS